MGNGADKALYALYDAADILHNYLEEYEEPARDVLMNLVHDLNAKYIDYASIVDMAEVEVVD